MTLSDTPRPRNRSMVAAMPGLSGSEKSTKPMKHMPASSALPIVVVLPSLRRARPSVRWPFRLYSAKRASICARTAARGCSAPLASCGRGAHLEDLGQRALGEHHVAFGARHQHRQALPHEVVGHLVELLPGGDVELAMLADGGVDRAGEAAFESGVQVDAEQGLLALPAFQIGDRLQGHLALGERAGLVGAAARSCCRSSRSTTGA